MSKRKGGSSYPREKLKEYLKNGASERLIPEIGTGLAYYYEGLARYFFAAQIAKNKVVLDLGCGSGFGSFILSKYGKAKLVLGIDISEDTIEYASEKYGSKKVIFKVGDVQKINEGKKYDLVTGFEIIEHIFDQKSFLLGIKKLLKNDGVAIISTPNKFTYPPGNPYHVKELTPKNFEKMLKSFFRSVQFYYETFDFSNSIRAALGEEIELEENFIKIGQNNFGAKPTTKNTHYIVAVVSDNKVLEIPSVSFSSQKVDNFDLRSGFMSLHTRFGKLQQEVLILNNYIESYRKELDNIYSSKFYKSWAFYGKMRQSLLATLVKKIIRS